MYTKTDSTLNFQEFVVKKYSLERISELLNRPFDGFFDLIRPSLKFLLPGTRFYVPCGRDGFRSLEDVPTTLAGYEMILHPLAMNLQDKGIRRIFLKIEWPHLIRKGPMIHIPTMMRNEKETLDIFRARFILEKRGLPFIINATINKEKYALEWDRREALNLFTGEDDE